MITSYQQAQKYLEQFIPFIIDHRITHGSKEADYLRLARMRYLLTLLDNPHKKFPAVVVSGTSGKGSVSYLIAHMLTIAGYKTGLTISPHLQRITERIQITDSLPIGAKRQIRILSDEKFIAMLNEVIPIIEKMRKSQYGVPSYYEILLGLALLAFTKEKVDIAVVEVGLEGKYDATNLIEPLIFILTNISLDHTNLLGNTVEKIAEEATFRLKNLKSLHDITPVVVTGAVQLSVIDLVEKRCGISGATLTRLHKDFEYIVKKETQEGVEFYFSSKSEIVFDLHKNFFVSLRGAYQAENASIAIEVVQKLKNFDFNIFESDIKNALSTAVFPGRFEVLKLSRYTIILDGAHNPVKMMSFLNALERIYPEREKIFVVGFKKGKDTKDMIKNIMQSADMLIVTRFTTTMDWGKNMGMDMDNIKKQILPMFHSLRPIKGIKPKVMYEENVQEALKKAIIASQSNNSQEPLIVVTGSLYLVGEVRNFVHPTPNTQLFIYKPI